MGCPRFAAWLPTPVGPVLYTIGMEEVLQANVFFFITAVAVVFFTLLASIALYQLIKILVAIRRITERVEAGSEQIADDLDSVRSFVRDRNPLVSWLRFIFPGRDTMRRKRSRTREDVTDED